MITMLGHVIVGIKLIHIDRQLDKMRNKRQHAFVAMSEHKGSVNTHQVMDPFHQRTPDEEEYCRRRRQYVNRCQDVRDLVVEKRSLSLARTERSRSLQLIATP